MLKMSDVSLLTAKWYSNTSCNPEGSSTIWPKCLIIWIKPKHFIHHHDYLSLTSMDVFLLSEEVLKFCTLLIRLIATHNMLHSSLLETLPGTAGPPVASSTFRLFCPKQRAIMSNGGVWLYFRIRGECSVTHTLRNATGIFRTSQITPPFLWTPSTTAWIGYSIHSPSLLLQAICETSKPLSPIKVS